MIMTNFCSNYDNWIEFTEITSVMTRLLKKEIRKKEQKIKKLKQKQDQLVRIAKVLKVKIPHTFGYHIGKRGCEVPQGKSKNIRTMSKVQLRRKKKSKHKSVQQFKKNVKHLRDLISKRKKELNRTKMKTEKKSEDSNLLVSEISEDEDSSGDSQIILSENQVKFLRSQRLSQNRPGRIDASRAGTLFK